MERQAQAFETYLIFDFGNDAAGLGRALAAVEQWRKSFKLQKQVLACHLGAGQSARVAVRLAFEEFEKLAFERWLERIPREEPFAHARLEIIHAGDERFGWARESFGPA